MPKKSTFGKVQVTSLIQQLQTQGVTSICFQDLINNMDQYIPEHGKSTKQLRVSLNAWKNLFEDAAIEIYLYEDKIKDKGIEFIKKGLLYFKDELNQTIINGEDFIKYLKDQFDFNLHRNSSFEKRYRVKEMMEELGISFLTYENQRRKTLELLKTFSKSNIVKTFKKENKIFTIPEIYMHMKKEISIASLYNYSVEISQLGIPLKTNKVLENFEQYDEKDIVNKLCSHILKKGITQIYAGKLSKIARQLSLPNIGYKKILEYKDYVKQIYDIDVLDFEKSKIEKEKISNTIEENEKFLNTAVSPNITRMESLPSSHDAEADILVLQDIGDELKELWLNYLELYITSLRDNRIAVRSELTDITGNLSIDTENKKIFFLLHDDLHIKNLTIEDILKLSNKEVLAGDKLYGIHRQNMFIGFLIYLHTNNKLLLSLKYIFQNILLQKKAQTELDLFKDKFSIHHNLQNAVDKNTFNTKELKFMRFVYFFFLSVNKSISIQEITDEYFHIFDQIDEKKSKLVKKILMQIGANIEVENSSFKYTEQYYTYMKKEKYHILIDIFNKHMTKKVKLKETTVPNQYYKNASSKFCSFFEFLDRYYSNETINANFLKEVFDYPDSPLLTYQQYIDQQSYSDSTKSSKVSIMLEVFSNTKGYENICSKNQMIKYSKSFGSKREAIEDDEIIFKLDDILTNRPPKSDYFANRLVDINMSWWPHLNRVVPFEPLIIKLHLRIPSRGKSLREIDRDNLLQYNNQNEVTGYYFVSDKNKNRKDPYVVPNIWKSELSFLEQLILYNKEYFPYLKRYYPKDITLKNGILPLFPNDKGTATYPEAQHMKYWTKVLVQAQMEFDNEGKNYSLVKSDEVDIPKTQEEFDRLTSGEFATFWRKYDIHSLRHTGITRNIRAGMPLELVRLLSGHSGFNTILAVYYHVNHKKLIQDWLKRENIDISQELNMHKISELFIKKEFFNEDFTAKNPEEILKILKNYHFFFPENRILTEQKKITLEEISKSDPLFWRPLRAGICTKQSCPAELDAECSLCPYFLTNYMFIEEIGINMQLDMCRTKKFSELIIENRENSEPEKNRRLKEQMKKKIDVFTGWLEIISIAEASYQDIIENDFTEESHSTDIINDSTTRKQSLFSIIPSINVDHGYLETLSQVFERNINDDETVKDITNIIANKIIKYAAKQKEYTEIEELDNKEIINWFLPRYKEASKEWQLHNNEKPLIKILNLLDNNKLKLEAKHENPILTK